LKGIQAHDFDLQAFEIEHYKFSTLPKEKKKLNFKGL